MAMDLWYQGVTIFEHVLYSKESLQIAKWAI